MGAILKLFISLVIFFVTYYLLEFIPSHLEWFTITCSVMLIFRVIKFHKKIKKIK